MIDTAYSFLDAIIKAIIMYDWLKTKDEQRVTITVNVVPGARKNQLFLSEQTLRLKIRERPVEGAANRGVLRYFSALFTIAPSRISILHGEHSREKVILLEGISPDRVISALTLSPDVQSK